MAKKTHPGATLGVSPKWSSRFNHQLNTVTRACNPSYSGSGYLQDLGSSLAWAKKSDSNLTPPQKKKPGLWSRYAGQNWRPHVKNNQSKKGQVESSVVEQLPSKLKALSSNQGLPKKKKRLTPSDHLETVDLSPKLNFLSSECWPHRLHCKFQEPLRHWGRDRPIRYSHTRKETVSCSSWMTHSDQRLWAQTASGSGSSPHSAILFAVCPVVLCMWTLSSVKWRCGWGHCEDLQR
jgi:hypothetical protein